MWGGNEKMPTLTDDTEDPAKDMAEFGCKNVNPNIQVKIEIDENQGYAPPTKLRLDTAKLRKLAWQPRFGLQEIFDRLVLYLKN